uniref:Uncharacterized protein n=3 Tax=Lygus hesperus TaxID=30085 RepID=A0A146KP62_LYGHE
MSSIAGHLLLCSFVLSASANQKTTFVFPEFPYKETNKNEMAFREYEAACEQNPTCALQKALARLKCVRECISPVCYQQIYYQDQLEDGEIDVRLNSFKGCFAQRTSRQR